MVKVVMDREFERYLEYQRSVRAHRVETLGTAVTAIALSTIDLGMSPLHEPEVTPKNQPEQIEPVEQPLFIEPRRRQLGKFAAESAELGYGLAA